MPLGVKQVSLSSIQPLVKMENLTSESFELLSNVLLYLF